MRHEFLVEIQIAIPSGLNLTDRAELEEREFRRGREFLESGVIGRIWRIPGRRANVGIWRADSASGLHEYLTSLPMFEYMDVRVTPLAAHPVEGAQE